MSKPRPTVISAPTTRREFTAASISALFVGMTVTITGCGGGSGGSASGPSSVPSSGGTASTPPSSGDKAGSISANHGHTAIITAAQLQAGGAVNLDIGGSDHSHTLQLSATAVQQIASGVRVSQATDPASTVGEYGSYGEHTHTVTFN